MSYTIDQVVGQYIKLRDLIAAKKKASKDEIAGLEQKQGVIETWLKANHLKDGVESVRTEHGTAFLKDVDFVKVEDWDLVQEHLFDALASVLPQDVKDDIDEIRVQWRSLEVWNLFNKAVNKTGVKEFIEVNEVPPPGVGYSIGTEVQIRRS